MLLIQKLGDSFVTYYISGNETDEKSLAEYFLPTKVTTTEKEKNMCNGKYSDGDYRGTYIIKIKFKF